MRCEYDLMRETMDRQWLERILNNEDRIRVPRLLIADKDIIHTNIKDYKN